MSQSERIFVIGHQNPDTDSICSAIAYAELCRKMGRDNVVAARAGNLNRQTEHVLEALDQETPVLLTDVYPRLRDVLQPSPAAVDSGAPLLQALDLMRQRDIRMLPVIDAESRPQGALILKRLTEHIFLSREGGSIRKVLSSPGSIRSCLQAEAVHLLDEWRDDQLNLFVGAMSLKGFRERLTGVEPGRIVLFVGDRHDIQQDAIEMGIRLLVVTGGKSPEADLVAMARDRGVSIITTSLDTATSALLARMSTPVHHLADRSVTGAHPDDRFDEVRSLLIHSSAPGVLVLDDAGKLCGVVTKSNLLRPSSLKLILVDHNELAQAVPGADQVEILEVIDHHRLGNFHTAAPIRFVNQPLGSTCSVVATLFQQADLVPSAKVAGLMLAGLLSDTVMLKSPTTSDLDHKLVEWFEQLSGLNATDFGHKMFRAGSALGTYPSVEKLLTADFKEYQATRCHFGIGQVEVVNFQEFDERYDEISQGLEMLARQRSLDFAGLLVTDIVQQNSQLIARGNKGLIGTIGYPQIETGRFDLKGVLSRKKQLIPHLLRVFKDV